MTENASKKKEKIPEEVLNPYSGAETQKPVYNNEQRINEMFDAMNKAQQTQISAGYNQARDEAQAVRDKLPGMYQDKANDLAVQYERNRRNFNTQANSRGLNTGASSQAALAQNSVYNRDFGRLRSDELEAIADADRNINQLTSKYQSEIAAAAAANDYKRAAALMDDANKEYSRRLSMAQNLAQFGDFSGFADIYGPSQAEQMFATWKAEHPDTAYNTGRISADEYFKIKGKYPKGYTPANTGAGGYGDYVPETKTPYTADSAIGAPANTGADYEQFKGAMRAVITNTDPMAAYSQIVESELYDQMSPDQQRQLAEAVGRRI